MSLQQNLIGILCAVVLFSSTVSGYPLSKPITDSSYTLEITQPTGNLSGYVTDIYMNPIEDALVRVYFHETYEENYSNSLGYYHVTNIPLCWCLKNATCSKQGYYPEWAMLSISENTTYDFILTPLNQSCYPVLNGTIGNNGWYISGVTITFVADEAIDAVFYTLDNETIPVEYISPFGVDTDDWHTLSWYYVIDGENSETMHITFKIDRTSPDMTLTSERVSLQKILLTADATDETSGIQQVDFYLDGALAFIDTISPYEGYITGIGTHTVKAIAFDAAGNQVNSTIITQLLFQTIFPHHIVLNFLRTVL
jgi:hypothetical protein